MKLAEAHPELVWPAESTIGEVLKRAGLTHRRKPRAVRHAAVCAAVRLWSSKPITPGAPISKAGSAPPDGTRCDPLTITDAHSRYLLRCHIVPKADTPHVAAIFDAAFHQHGLPRVIHYTDNGAPFASRAPGGLSACRCDG